MAKGNERVQEVLGMQELAKENVGVLVQVKQELAKENVGVVILGITVKTL